MLINRKFDTHKEDTLHEFFCEYCDGDVDIDCIHCVTIASHFKPKIEHEDDRYKTCIHRQIKTYLFESSATCIANQYNDGNIPKCMVGLKCKEYKRNTQ